LDRVPDAHDRSADHGRPGRRQGRSSHGARRRVLDGSPGATQHLAPGDRSVAGERVTTRSAKEHDDDGNAGADRRTRDGFRRDRCGRLSGGARARLGGSGEAEHGGGWEREGVREFGAARGADRPRASIPGQVPAARSADLQGGTHACDATMSLVQGRAGGRPWGLLQRRVLPEGGALAARARTYVSAPTSAPRTLTATRRRRMPLTDDRVAGAAATQSAFGWR